MKAETQGAMLFLTGWPECGQAVYGEWLAANSGFRHLNLDLPVSERGEAGRLWEEHVPAGIARFVTGLRKTHARWVITDSDPVRHLPIFGALREAGFELWFLMARTEALSRSCWQQRTREADPSARPGDWLKLAGTIRGSARELRPYFRDRCITTLATSRELLDMAAFAAQIGIATSR
jgi:hypothetical protein